MSNTILQKLGIEELNAMQLAASEAILHSNKDVVILSPTGSGKTLAYLLPLVQLLDASKDDVQAVVIVPGRELALQSATVLKVPKCKKMVMAVRNQIASSHHTLSGLLYDAVEDQLYTTRIYDIEPIVDPMGVGDAFIAAYIHAHQKWQKK